MRSGTVVASLATVLLVVFAPAFAQDAPDRVGLEGNFDTVEGWKKLDFLDGLIVPNSCDNVRRIYDHWTRQMKTPFVEMVSLPRKAVSPSASAFQSGRPPSAFRP